MSTGEGRGARLSSVALTAAFALLTGSALAQAGAASSRQPAVSGPTLIESKDPALREFVTTRSSKLKDRKKALGLVERLRTKTNPAWLPTLHAIVQRPRALNDSPEPAAECRRAHGLSSSRCTLKLDASGRIHGRRRQ